MRCVKCGLDLQTIGGRVSSPDWGVCPTCSMNDQFKDLRQDLRANQEHNHEVERRLEKVQRELRETTENQKEFIRLQEKMIRLEQERVITLDMAKQKGRTITVDNPSAIRAHYNWATDSVTVTANSSVFENTYLQAAMIEGATETVVARCIRWTRDSVKANIVYAGHNGWTHMCTLDNKVDNLNIDSSVSIADFVETVNADYSIQITVTKWYIDDAELHQLYLDGLTKRQREMNVAALIAERRQVAEEKAKKEAEELAKQQEEIRKQEIEKYKTIALVVTMFAGIAAIIVQGIMMY